MEVLATSHVHSSWSYDGSWSLAELSARFAERGCRVLMMTEHDKGFTASRFAEYRDACAQVSSDRILVLPGIEYSDPDNRVHVLTWGPAPFLGEGLSTGAMLDGIRASDGIAVLAHPSRKAAWKCFESNWKDKLLGVEAWNRKYDGWAPSKTAPALFETGEAIPFVGLDFHTKRQLFPLTMTLEIDGTITEESVLRCLKSRRCYARAFGLPLTSGILGGSMSLLAVAERARRSAASFARSVKSNSPLAKA